MKRSVLYLLTAWVLCLATGCRRTAPYPPAMQQAESLMNARPDSAIQLLQGMEDTVPMLSEEARMYWHLLGIQARDKLYITHTDDSLINNIVQYYEASDDKDRLMMAYYYQGSTYRDMNDAPRALKAYHQAIDAGEGTKNLTLMGQTYGQMGTLLTYQKIYDEAMEAKKKALHYYTLAKDSMRYPYLVRDIARIYSAREESDSAISYYEKASWLANNQGNFRMQNNILCELGCLYYSINKTDIAYPLLSEVLSKDNKLPNALLFMSLIHKDNSQLDSARYYLNQTLVHGEIHQKRSAYKQLAKLEEESGNTKRAAVYQQRYLELNDSIHEMVQTENVEKYNLLYKFHRSEKKNDFLEQENLKQRGHINMLVFVVVVFFIVFSFLVYLYRKKKENAEIQVLRFNLIQQRQNRKMQTYQNENALLKQNISDIKEQNSLLQRELQQSKEKIEVLSNVSFTNSEDKTSGLLQSELYLRFHNSGHYGEKLQEEDWDKLQETLDTIYPDFTHRLLLLWPKMKIHHVKICHLVKLGFSNDIIAKILFSTPASISIARKRLYQKMSGESGKPEDFNRFIADF